MPCSFSDPALLNPFPHTFQRRALSGGHYQEGITSLSTRQSQLSTRERRGGLCWSEKLWEVHGFRVPGFVPLQHNPSIPVLRAPLFCNQPPRCHRGVLQSLGTLWLQGQTLISGLFCYQPGTYLHSLWSGLCVLYIGTLPLSCAQLPLIYFIDSFQWTKISSIF